MMKEAHSAVTGRKKSNQATGKSGVQTAVASGAVFHQYQSALQHLQQGKYEKALATFEKLLSSAPVEIQERCRMYISTCQKQMDHSQLSFSTPEEHYDYAVSQLNTGYYEQAREQFQSIVANYPEADYVYYGLALLDSITGDAEECLRNLSTAIELNPNNRLQARADNDFQNMVDDPRFTELLYPESPYEDPQDMQDMQDIT